MKRNLPILFALLLTASLAGCSKDDLQNSPDDGSTDTPVGETVEVALNLDVLAPNQPAQGAKTQRNATFAQTKSPATERIIVSEHTGSMLMELVETPQEPTTRAVDDSAIANFWMLQFDGSAPTATLVKMQYFASYTPEVQVNLLAGTDQRVVILVNSFDSTLRNRFAVGTSTYQTLLDASRTLTAATDVLTNSGGNLPMSGTATGTVEKGTVLNVPIRRDVAQISVQLRNGSLQMVGKWKVQLCNVPQNNYYMPHREDAVFPAAEPATIAYTEATLPALNTTTFVTAGTWYVPCNCRGTVAGTTSIKRWTNIPKGATYLKVWGDTGDSVDLYTTTTYSIPLGANFTDDYNLLPNYQYTYRITLYENYVNDSQVEVKDYDYVGMYGGELKDIGGGVWQFTKKLYVEKEQDLYQWAKVDGNYMSLSGFDIPNYTIDGRTMTWRINREGSKGGSLTEFPAANHCYSHSGNPINPTSATDLVWYLPAANQLACISMVYETFGTTYFPGTQSGYWSSTAVLTDAVSWYLSDTEEVRVGYANSPSSTYYVRCVREY